jgi:hypothetical protein
LVFPGDENGIIQLMKDYIEDFHTYCSVTTIFCSLLVIPMKLGKCRARL